VEPLRVFEAAHGALRALGPAPIIADDLQWADEQTLALCNYLMRAASSLNQPVGLIVASRPSQNAEAFQASLDQLPAGESRAVLEHAALSREEGVRLATDLAPGLHGDQAAAVWARARGSPFWIEALTRGSGAALDAEKVVSRRLRLLDTDPTALFAVLCVAGRPMGSADLADLLSWETPC
jgi:hypothetical protein